MCNECLPQHYSDDMTAIAHSAEIAFNYNIQEALSVKLSTKTHNW